MGVSRVGELALAPLHTIGIHKVVEVLLAARVYHLREQARMRVQTLDQFA